MLTEPEEGGGSSLRESLLSRRTASRQTNMFMTVDDGGSLLASRRTASSASDVAPMEADEAGRPGDVFQLRVERGTPVEQPLANGYNKVPTAMEFLEGFSPRIANMLAAYGRTVSPEDPHVMFASPISHQAPVFRQREYRPDPALYPSQDAIIRDPTKELLEPDRSASQSALHGFTFGLINFVVCVPTLISYAAIVFSVGGFYHDMPSLTKLFFLSSAVHQFVFTIASTLPFSLGQVQDVGLIFLAQIARAVYHQAVNQEVPHDAAVATVLVALALATVATGGVVWVIGKLKLSSYVQLLPLPVIGGYLGYIGYFCLAAGASLGTGRTVDSLSTWGQFFVWDLVLLSKLFLSLAFAVFLFYISYNVKHVAALPTVLILTPILFFVILWATGVPLEDAQAGGWIPYADSHPAAGWQCFELYNGFRDIGWSTLPAQLPLVCGLMCVVSFGSILDVAAIQTGVPEPLDFDAELRTIGLSNIASGGLGGFTGSYIFSQTIFSQRQGVTSPLHGWTIAIGEFILFLVPIDILQFFPGFYVGGIMAFFGVDIMLDWLVHSRAKVSSYEYGLLLTTFFLVMQLSVITGCALGVAACAVTFIAVYSTAPAVNVRSDRFSSAMRSGDERRALLEMVEKTRIVCLEFQGYLFFGASLQLSDSLIHSVRDLGALWVVMDFTNVNGIDSTSARAISKLVTTLRTDKIRVSVSMKQDQLAQDSAIRRLLQENLALPSEDDIEAGQAQITDSLDHALSWCERGALREEGVLPPFFAERDELDSPASKNAQRRLITRILGEYLYKEEHEHLLDLAGKFAMRRFKPGEILFRGGTREFDGLLVIIEGTVISEDHNRFLGNFTFEAGALIGEIDFYLQQPHHYTARAGEPGCKACVIMRETVATMEKEDARLVSLLHRVCLRSVCMLTSAYEGLHQK